MEILIAFTAENGYSRHMDRILCSRAVSGKITIPSSKSQTIRAMLLATFAKGRSIVRNPLDSQDTRSCIDACRAFGASVTVENPGRNEPPGMTIDSPGTFPSHTMIDCGNSGTTLYLATGVAASIGKPVTFTGDAQLRRRPVGNLLRALADLGAEVEPLDNKTMPEYPPFTITGPLIGGSTTIFCHTSQHLSALLLGCPLAKGNSRILVPLLNERPYVQITRSWLDLQGISYDASESLDRFDIPGNQRFQPFETTISGDYSSASFFFCAAAIAGGSVTVAGLDPDDPQGDKEILSILRSMGCAVSWTAKHEVTVTGPGPGRLKGGTFDLNTIPDALPVLAATACYTTETTVLGNVPQARIKETDRIAVMHSNLTALGAVVEEREDALVIHGTGSLRGGVCDGFGDHRVIMAMAVASLGCDRDTIIRGVDAIDVTFPTFFTLLDSITGSKENTIQ